MSYVSATDGYNLKQRTSYQVKSYKVCKVSNGAYDIILYFLPPLYKLDELYNF